MTPKRKVSLYRALVCLLTLVMLAAVVIQGGMAKSDGAQLQAQADAAQSSQAQGQSIASQGDAAPAEPLQPRPHKPAALFLNVGKADCAVLFLGEKTFLVDTGSKKSAPAMLRALAGYGIGALDGVFVTHTDKDHVGGLKALLKSGIAVGQLYAPKHHTEKSDADHPVYEAGQENQIPMTWLSAGDEIDLGDGIRFAVLGPISKAQDSENNNSLVMNLETPDGNILLTGDMEMAQETELLNAKVIPQATVLKVGHHGEDDASSKPLIATVKPQWAVISTSTQEEPDTPDPKVIRLLWAVKANVAVTQEASCGILITLDGGTATGQGIEYIGE